MDWVLWGWIIATAIALLILLRPWPLIVVTSIVQWLEKRLRVKLPGAGRLAALNAKVEMGTPTFTAISVEANGVTRTANIPQDLTGYYLIAWLDAWGAPQVSVVPFEAFLVEHNHVVTASIGVPSARTYILSTDDPSFRAHAEANASHDSALGGHDVDGPMETESSTSEESTTP